MMKEFVISLKKKKDLKIISYNICVYQLLFLSLHYKPIKNTTLWKNLTI